jgi:hypothetical protein
VDGRARIFSGQFSDFGVFLMLNLSLIGVLSFDWILVWQRWAAYGRSLIFGIPL